jgi:hypothetical protein
MRARILKVSPIATALASATLLAVSLANVCSARPPAPPLTLTAQVTLLERPGEALPIRLATRNLQNDFAQVFGIRPRIVTRTSAAGPLTVMIGTETQIPPAMRPTRLTAPESFAIAVEPAAWNPAARVVVLSGPDVLGTIYAIYQFSQDYLGVDPMAYWTGKRPPRRRRIVLPPGLRRIFPPPVFKYRGFFINDEDLLTGWAPAPKSEHTGISLRVMNKIYETILRLKGNMVIPGTWIFPNDPRLQLAAERGLIVTQHHAIPLGVNVARWPPNVPYNFSKHPRILEHAWRNAVHEYAAHEHILWEVGLRGLSDESYAAVDPSVRGNNARLGMLISRAIAVQMRIVRAVHPHAQFVTDFWQEGAHLERAGDLHIPPGVIRVWADDGYGIPEDKGDLAPGEGVYYHVAMLNGSANHLSEMIPVRRIYAQLGRYIRARATAYFLLNVSNIRPVAMTTEAAMDVAWKGVPTGGAAGYYQRWARREFGARAAPTLARVYAQYFRAFDPVHTGPRAGQSYGDEFFFHQAQHLLISTMVQPPYYFFDGQAPKWTPIRILDAGLHKPFFIHMGPKWLPYALRRDIGFCAPARQRWRAVWKAALAAEPLVTPTRRQYYEAEMLTMIAINRDGVRILYRVGRAIREYRHGATAAALTEVRGTLPLFAQIRAMERRAEYGKWKHWYRGEWLVGIRHTRALVLDFIHYLHDPTTILPPPFLDNGWQGYYHIMQFEGNRTVDVR